MAISNKYKIDSNAREYVRKPVGKFKIHQKDDSVCCWTHNGIDLQRKRWSKKFFKKVHGHGNCKNYNFLRSNLLPDYEEGVFYFIISRETKLNV